MARPLYEIAFEIDNDWSAQGKGVSPYARPYLVAMFALNKITDSYSGDSIVRYFLSNATTWRGEKAKSIKAELKALL